MGVLIEANEWNDGRVIGNGFENPELLKVP
jgi:hypothetical protein